MFIFDQQRVSKIASQRGFGAKMTSYQRRCDIIAAFGAKMTSYQRRCDVIAAFGAKMTAYQRRCDVIAACPLGFCVSLFLRGLYALGTKLKECFLVCQAAWRNR